MLSLTMLFTLHYIGLCVLSEQAHNVPRMSASRTRSEFCDLLCSRTIPVYQPPRPCGEFKAYLMRPHPFVLVTNNAAFMLMAFASISRMPTSSRGS